MRWHHVGESAGSLSGGKEEPASMSWECTICTTRQVASFRGRHPVLRPTQKVRVNLTLRKAWMWSGCVAQTSVDERGRSRFSKWCYRNQKWLHGLAEEEDRRLARWVLWVSIWSRVSLQNSLFSSNLISRRSLNFKNLTVARFFVRMSAMLSSVWT